MRPEPFGGVFADRRVLVTGHTGFVGSWLVRWLHRLGADVVGFSRGTTDPPVPPPGTLTQRHGDICDMAEVGALFTAHRPELVLHLAGQTLVSEGFAAPAATFRSNVLGCLNILDAAANCQHTAAVLVLSSPASTTTVTAPVSPYAASKHAVDALVAGYAHPRTRLPARDLPLRLAVVRPGVMFGGDWAANRLVPDVIRSTRAGQPVPLHRPASVRPWQHVLDGIGGLLSIGCRLLTGDLPRLSYDLGRPDPTQTESARELVVALLTAMGIPNWPVALGDPSPPDADDALLLGCAAASADLGWRPVWDIQRAALATARWYRSAPAGPSAIATVTDELIEAFTGDALRAGVTWSGADPSAVAPPNR